MNIFHPTHAATAGTAPAAAHSGAHAAPRPALHPLMAVMAACVIGASAVGTWVMWRTETLPVAPPPMVVCLVCGVVESVTSFQVQGEPSGAGAIIGAGVGGALGSRLGKGRGRYVTTGAGVVGGWLLGQTVEKRVRSYRVWAIKLRMDDGSERRIHQRWAPVWGVGEPVRVVDGRVISF